VTEAERRARVLEAAAREPSPVRSAVNVRNIAVLALAACASAELFYGWGGLRMEPRPAALVVETALGASAIAAAAIWGGLARGGRMLGRPGRTLVAVAVLTPLLLFAWKVAWSAQDPAMTVEWPERPGFRCLRLSLATASLPFLAMLFVRRHSDPLRPRLTGTAIGVAAAAYAWVFTDLWCPVAFVPHLLLGHLLPMAILAAAGALVGPWAVGLRGA
jgi:hypothetical protein